MYWECLRDETKEIKSFGLFAGCQAARIHGDNCPCSASMLMNRHTLLKTSTFLREAGCQTTQCLAWMSVHLYSTYKFSEFSICSMHWHWFKFVFCTCCYNMLQHSSLGNCLCLWATSFVFILHHLYISLHHLTFAHQINGYQWVGL